MRVCQTDDLLDEITRANHLGPTDAKSGADFLLDPNHVPPPLAEGVAGCCEASPKLSPAQHAHLV